MAPNGMQHTTPQHTVDGAAGHAAGIVPRDMVPRGNEWQTM
jgi:hypothetical protein